MAKKRIPDLNHKNRKYSKEEILSDVKKVISETGDSSLKNYKKHGKYSEFAVVQFYGNWTKTIKALGIEPKIHHFCTKEELIEDIIKVFNETNCTLRENYLSNGKYSRCIIKKFFGTWNNLLKELNYEINMIKPGQYTKEDIIEEYKNLCEKYNKELNAYEFRTLGKYSQPVIESAFGSFSNLKKEMGLSYNISFYTDEDMKKIFHDIYNKYGRINSRLFNNESRTNITTVINKYGSFENACRIFGVPYTKNMSLFQEEITKNVEELLGSNFETEKTFDWLVFNHKMRIDLYYEKLKLAIEIDGAQHYEYVSYFHSKYDFELCQARDRKKEELLKKHGIDLIRINQKNMKDLKNILKDYINITKNVNATC